MFLFSVYGFIYCGQSGPVLVPAGLAVRGARHKAKTMKLEEVTKPMNEAASAKMQQILLQRLLKNHKTPLLGSGAKDCVRILTVLMGSISPSECEGKLLGALHSYSLFQSLYMHCLLCASITFYPWMGKANELLLTLVRTLSITHSYVFVSRCSLCFRYSSTIYSFFGGVLATELPYIYLFFFYIILSCSAFL